jgi:hypothetical protein
MKLLYCPHCYDVRKLGGPYPVPALPTKCRCEKSWGMYTDHINAVYGGDAVMLGFSNPSLRYAIEDNLTRPPRADGKGRSFEAFIIPDSAPTVRREK